MKKRLQGKVDAILIYSIGKLIYYYNVSTQHLKNIIYKNLKNKGVLGHYIFHLLYCR